MVIMFSRNRRIFVLKVLKIVPMYKFCYKTKYIYIFVLFNHFDDFTIILKYGKSKYKVLVSDASHV